MDGTRVVAAPGRSAVAAAGGGGRCRLGYCCLKPGRRLRTTTTTATMGFGGGRGVLVSRRLAVAVRGSGSDRMEDKVAAPAPPKPFQSPREKDGLQKFLSEMSTTMAYLWAFGVVAVSAVAGYALGGGAPGSFRNPGRAVGTAVGVGTAAFVLAKLQDVREDAAAIDLYNELVKKGDAGALQREDVKAIGSKYGVDVSKALVSELKRIYDQYLESIIPKGDVSLTGKEPEQLISLKEALGLGDEDAASVHMDVGRRLARSKFEMGTKAAEAEQRKAFQRWLYISYRVFGERKAAFLLPIARVFRLNQAQILIAIRDNAKAIFNAQIQELAKQQGGVLRVDRSQFEKLRTYQLEVQLTDDVAEEVMISASQARVEAGLKAALNNIRERTRVQDYSSAIKEIHDVLEFNRAQETLAEEKDSKSLPPGLGRITIHGGAFEAKTSTSDLRDIYRVFMEERLGALDGQFTVKLEKDTDDLRVILGLGPREASNIRQDVTSKLYRRLLRDEVSSGRLDAAESKAAVLQRLCDRLGFKPEFAALMHKTIYKQKLESILEKDKIITDDDSQELSRLRKLLCIQEKDINDVAKETCGAILRNAIEGALATGIDRFSTEDRKNVKRVIKDLRISQPMAKDVLDDASRKIFLQYISASRTKNNRLDAAKELKKMVFFSNIVVAPLLEDIKGDDKAQDMQEALKEVAETLSKAKEAVEGEKEEDGKEEESTSNTEEVSASSEDEKTEVPNTLDKAQRAAADFAASGDSSSGVKMSSQKEINLGKDLELRDRQDIYQNYLLYCMSGDTISMPMGGRVVLERDMAEFGRLSQLGDILGLSPIEVMTVHQDLAEQAFRQQVQIVVADGQLTKEKTDSLNEMREKMGLSEASAQKIIKGVQNERLAAGLQSAKAMGELSLQKLLDMRESGVEIENFTSIELRRSLFQKEVERILSDGQGALDQEYVFESLPSNLSLDESEARKVVTDIASTKKNFQLVQALSDLRRKKFDELVQDVNNFLVCSRVVGTNGAANGKPLWDRRDEILDLYSVFYWKVNDDSKLSELQQIFNISDSEAKSLQGVVDSGGMKWTEEVKDEELFF